MDSRATTPIKDRVEETFAALAARTSAATGSFWAFTAAFSVVLGWALLGPTFRFSDDWQLVINTGTTIVTFLMVFVIQHAQNKDMRAVQLKLNEIIAAIDGASNRLIDAEELPDRELDRLYTRYRHLVVTAAKASPGVKTTVENEREEEVKTREPLLRTEKDRMFAPSSTPPLPSTSVTSSVRSASLGRR